MDICTAICRVFFFTSLYVYSILCSVGRTDKQSSELIYTNECVECVSQLIISVLLLLSPTSAILLPRKQIQMCLFFFTHTHKCITYIFFISSVFSHSTRNFRSYVFTKLEAYAKYLCNINDFYRLVNGFFFVVECACM